MCFINDLLCDIFLVSKKRVSKLLLLAYEWLCFHRWGESWNKRPCRHTACGRCYRPTKPKEVATFQIPGAVGQPHSFALDEELGILCVAWAGNGVYAIDVSGTLLGELDKQGRKIADITNYGIIGCGSAGTCSYSLQLHNGLIYVSDMSRGLMVLRPLF